MAKAPRTYRSAAIPLAAGPNPASLFVHLDRTPVRSWNDRSNPWASHRTPRAGDRSGLASADPRRRTRPSTGGTPRPGQLETTDTLVKLPTAEHARPALSAQRQPAASPPAAPDTAPTIEIARTDRSDATFVSTDTIRFDATVSACDDVEGVCSAIQWTVHGVSDDSGNGDPHTGLGGEFAFQPNPTNRPTTGSRQPNPAIRYQVEASVEGASARFDLVQDETDIIRQEYIDYGTAFQPTRAQISPPGNALFNTGNYGQIAVQSGDMQGNFDSLVANWNAASAAANVTDIPGITVSSGYRNPRRNTAVGSTTINSRHTRGRALDVYPDAEPYDQTTYQRLRTAGSDVSGITSSICENGATLVSDCGDGTDHVHVQW